MNTILNDFGAFLDSLRKSRNMSREEFIEDIMSLRQYQRYVNGESSLNNDKLFRLIDKLGMNYFSVHMRYFNDKRDEVTKLNTIYGAIRREDMKLASKLINEISCDKFYDEYYKSYYKLCELLILKKTKKMPVSLVTDKLKQLIDYPNCLNNKIINFVEYVSFIHISSYSSSMNDDTRILYFLYDKIKLNDISTDSIPLDYIPSTFSHIARRLGAIEEFEKSLFIAQKGIHWCLSHDSLNSLSHLLIYKSFALKDLNRREESLESAKKAFALLYVEGNKSKTEQFTKTFELNFKMKVSEL